MDVTLLFIYSSVDGHFSCYYFLAVMNNGAVAFLYRFFVWTYVFISLEYVPVSGFAGSYDYSF